MFSLEWILFACGSDTVQWSPHNTSFSVSGPEGVQSWTAAGRGGPGSLWAADLTGFPKSQTQWPGFAMTSADPSSPQLLGICFLKHPIWTASSEWPPHGSRFWGTFHLRVCRYVQVRRFLKATHFVNDLTSPHFNSSVSDVPPALVHYFCFYLFLFPLSHLTEINGAQSCEDLGQTPCVLWPRCPHL